jgi:hypothetical protein
MPDSQRFIYPGFLSRHTDLLEISHVVKEEKYHQHSDQKRFHISMISQSYPQVGCKVLRFVSIVIHRVMHRFDKVIHRFTVVIHRLNVTDIF